MMSSTIVNTLISKTFTIVVLVKQCPRREKDLKSFLSRDAIIDDVIKNRIPIRLEGCDSGHFSEKLSKSDNRWLQKTSECQKKYGICALLLQHLLVDKCCKILNRCKASTELIGR